MNDFNVCVGIFECNGFFFILYNYFFGFLVYILSFYYIVLLCFESFMIDWVDLYDFVKGYIEDFL